jgi:hypothetical protein
MSVFLNRPYARELPFGLLAIWVICAHENDRPFGLDMRAGEKDEASHRSVKHDAFVKLMIR